MFGVIKLFDSDGRLQDASFYFGRGPVTFGESEKPYTLTRVVFTGPDGIQRPIVVQYTDYPGTALWGRNRLSDRITLFNLEVPPYMKR